MSYRTLKEEIEVLELGLPPQEGDGFIGGRLNPDEANLVLIPVLNLINFCCSCRFLLNMASQKVLCL